MINNSFRMAYIYIRNHFAGILKETEDGYSFKYDEDYLKIDNPVAISLTLPLQKEEYASKTLFAFFDGLIPEGWLLNIVSHNWKIDLKDRFGLLLIACKDCIGCVVIRSERI